VSSSFDLTPINPVLLGRASIQASFKAAPHCQGIHFVLRFPMTTAATKPWISLLATGGLMITAALVAPPAKAQTPCMSGLPVSTIVSSGPSGYSCELGGLNYTFFDNLAELDNPGAIVNFQTSQLLQVITFDNLTTEGAVGFFYKLISPFETITDIQLSYSQDPPLPDPIMEILITAPTLPKPPSPVVALTVETVFESDPSVGPPFQTLRSLTHTIHKTPAPLPLAGAGLAFGFSRKLRRRIHNASHKRGAV
jgi:hypothetical protein